MARPMQTASRRSSTPTDVSSATARKRPREDEDEEGSASQEAEDSINDTVQNEYAGYTFPTTGDRAVETLDLDEFYARHGDDATRTAAAFFHEYVARRKPVLIKGRLRDPEWAADKKWTDAYLSKAAGAARVMVEAREDARARFGRGREVPMDFARFLHELQQGSELLYLTTQELPLGPDDRPALTSPPVTELLRQGDLPLRPSLLGHLVPQNLNLWMGRSADGATSGLHHDYHDNIYVLLRGHKTFRLYSPADAPRMYTVGDLARVYANGRINYANQPPTHADGRELGADKALEAAERLRAAAVRAFEGEGEGQGGEDELDAALEAVLEAEMEGEEGSEEEEEDEDGAVTPPWEPAEGGKGKTTTAAAAVSGASAAEEPKEKPPPRNFSRVPDPLHPDREAFPLFPPQPPVEAAVAPGAMLYLPAGWFHEVISSGGVHAAVNWWFHPPDNLTFEEPYTSPFWPRDWEARMMALGKEAEEG